MVGEKLCAPRLPHDESPRWLQHAGGGARATYSQRATLFLVILSRAFYGEGSLHFAGAVVLPTSAQILQPAKNAGFRMTKPQGPLIANCYTFFFVH